MQASATDAPLTEQQRVMVWTEHTMPAPPFTLHFHRVDDLREAERQGYHNPIEVYRAFVDYNDCTVASIMLVAVFPPSAPIALNASHLAYVMMERTASYAPTPDVAAAFKKDGPRANGMMLIPLVMQTVPFCGDPPTLQDRYLHANPETAFMSHQATWGPDSPPAVASSLETVPCYETYVPYMTDRHGDIIKGPTGDQPRDFSHVLPPIISPDVGGWLLAFYRRADPRITMDDIRARIPVKYEGQALKNKKNDLQQECTRFHVTVNLMSTTQMGKVGTGVAVTDPLAIRGLAQRQLELNTSWIPHAKSDKLVTHPSLPVGTWYYSPPPHPTSPFITGYLTHSITHGMVTARVKKAMDDLSTELQKVKPFAKAPKKKAGVKAGAKAATPAAPQVGQYVFSIHETAMPTNDNKSASNGNASSSSENLDMGSFSAWEQAHIFGLPEDDMTTISQTENSSTSAVRRDPSITRQPAEGVDRQPSIHQGGMAGHESTPSLPHNKEDPLFGTYGFGSQQPISPSSSDDVAPDAAEASAYDGHVDLNPFTEIHQAYAGAYLTTGQGHAFGDEHTSSLHDADENICSTDDHFSTPSYRTTSPFPNHHQAHASATLVPEIAMHQQLDVHHEQEVSTVNQDAADSSGFVAEPAWDEFLDLDQGEAEDLRSFD